MGLILKTGYTIKDLGIQIPEAYAKISHIAINNDGTAHASFNIQQTREDVINKRAIDRVNISTNINKEEPIYSQLYIKAKETIFIGWEDDIVESDNVEESFEETTTVE